MLTLLHVSWLNMKRDRVAQALTFLLPIVFFSIFASVFGGRGGGDPTPRVQILIVDEDHSELSRRIAEAMAREQALRVRPAPPGAPALDRAEAERLVRNGDVPVAVIIPRGLGAAFQEQGFAATGPAVELLSDPSDPIAPQMVQGLLQKVTMTAAPDLMMQGGMKQFERHAGALTPEQRKAIELWLPMLRSQSGAGSGTTSSSGGGMGVAVRVVDIMRTDDRPGSLISFYAAGIGVMFLLFSMVGGAGGVLLEEVESGTLERLLATNIGMAGILAGKWLFLTLMGMAQLTVMFLWGALAFGLPLFSHLSGFFVMTAATACAAAALGLVLASLARSRAQLSGFSTILILTMSALGGSMFPRFLMTEGMQRIGLVTFNAWALDGYLKVFWRHAPVWALWPQVLVLAVLAAAFMLLARLLARRWELA
jgi:ABC-2 type transport system permease protein